MLYPAQMVTSLIAATAATAPQEPASPWATGFFAVVAFGALIYFVITRRAEKKECRHELSLLRTAERKRAVREDLARRAQTKVDEARRKAELLEERGAASRQVERAKAEVALCQQELDKHHSEVDKALTREREALATLEACMAANDVLRENHDEPNEPR